MSPQAAQTAPNAVVVGMGRTGLSVARHLQRSGFRIAVTDSRAAPPELEGVKALGSSVVTRTGGFDVQLLERADIVVTSPGVPLDDPFFVQARARGLDIVGDIGALALGAALGTIAVIVRQELVVLIMGGIFVVETASVIIQVASFKTTGKRVFRMAPIHHHYELKGWAEPKVIVRFWIITFILVLAGLATLKLR